MNIALLAICIAVIPFLGISQLYKRVYYGAFLIDEHITFLERIITTAASRKGYFKQFIKNNKDPDKEKKNLQALDDFDDVVKERMGGFLNRSKGVIEKCFNSTSVGDEVDPNVVKEIGEIRFRNALDARKFFLQEMPSHLYKLYADWEVLRTARMPNQTYRLVNLSEALTGKRLTSGRRAMKYNVDLPGYLRQKNTRTSENKEEEN